MKKVLAIQLDGYDPALGLEMMTAGEMPAFSDLAHRSARFELDQGADAIRTGLTGEHVVTGLTPTDAKRWDSLHFYPDTYDVWQEGASFLPFTATLPIKAVVFDSPYFDLKRSPNVEGIVNWGAHDPGVATLSRPDELLSEVIKKFGASPAQKWHHELSWNSIEHTQQAVDSLLAAVATRGNIVEWLLKERIKDWDLALISIAEAHSAIEGLWHGIDPNHPLNGAPSAAIAGEGVRSVYRGIDNLVGRLTANLEDTSVVLFSMHGMGPNRGDTASFLLLAELLYRHTFGKAFFNREGVPSEKLNQQVDLPLTEDWYNWVRKGFPKKNKTPKSVAKKIACSLKLKSIKRPHRAANQEFKKKPVSSKYTFPINWMPIMSYKPFWPDMPAFAIPSYFDGRVRINLQGREKNGIVPINKYIANRDELVRLISECKDPITGQGVVEQVVFPQHKDPMEMTETEADIVFVWSGAISGFLHSDHGKIGPVPYRRTGGHTGGNGFAYVTDTNLAPGYYGTRSAFDAIATLPDILKMSDIAHMSGKSLLIPKKLVIGDPKDKSLRTS